MNYRSIDLEYAYVKLLINYNDYIFDIVPQNGPRVKLPTNEMRKTIKTRDSKKMRLLNALFLNPRDNYAFFSFWACIGSIIFNNKNNRVSWVDDIRFETWHMLFSFEFVLQDVFSVIYLYYVICGAITLKQNLPCLHYKKKELQRANVVHLKLPLWAESREEPDHKGLLCVILSYIFAKNYFQGLNLDLMVTWKQLCQLL